MIMFVNSSRIEISLSVRAGGPQSDERMEEVREDVRGPKARRTEGNDVEEEWRAKRWSR